MWSALPKTQICVVTLRYSPCEDTPTATMHRSCNDRWTIATNLHQIFMFVSLLPLAVQRRSDTLPVITPAVAAVGSLQKL
jgi:hypothetical protein